MLPDENPDLPNPTEPTANPGGVDLNKYETPLEPTLGEIIPEEPEVSAVAGTMAPADRIQLDELRDAAVAVRAEIGKLVVGQREFVDLLIASLLAGGHVLVEGVPGIAKTLTAKLLAKTIAADYSRIQFTPDLMPSDVTGTTIYNMGNSEFEFTKGPV